jgi:hypothetical protein
MIESVVLVVDLWSSSGYEKIDCLFSVARLPVTRAIPGDRDEDRENGISVLSHSVSYTI